MDELMIVKYSKMDKSFQEAEILASWRSNRNMCITIFKFAVHYELYSMSVKMIVKTYAHLHKVFVRRSRYPGDGFEIQCYDINDEQIHPFYRREIDDEDEDFIERIKQLENDMSTLKQQFGEVKEISKEFELLQSKFSHILSYNI